MRTLLGWGGSGRGGTGLAVVTCVGRGSRCRESVLRFRPCSVATECGHVLAFPGLRETGRAPRLGGVPSAVVGRPELGVGGVNSLDVEFGASPPVPPDGKAGNTKEDDGNQGQDNIAEPPVGV